MHDFRYPDSKDGLTFEQRSAMIRAFDAKIKDRKIGPCRVYEYRGERMHLYALADRHGFNFKQAAEAIDAGQNPARVIDLLRRR